MSSTVEDHQFMARAIQLAERGLNTTSPNPRVGCVLVKDHQIIGEGFHIEAGTGHAEVNALNSLDDPQAAVGATAYVTLEPCSHHGRTGPCCQALEKAGIARLVYGMSDPNPQVSGRGLKYLQDRNIAVEGPVLEEQAQALNPGFIHRMVHQRPYVRLKLAMSLDGRTAMASGESQWITGPKARAQVQALRARSCAVVTGHTTVSMDQARLTVRDSELPKIPLQPLKNHPVPGRLRRPLRVVLDSNATLTGHEPFFHEQSECLWVTAGAKPNDILPTVEWKSLPDIANRVSLTDLLDDLAQRQCNEILVECGATLAGAFVEQGLVDEIVVFIAPTLMGSDARPLLALPLASMSEKVELEITDIRSVGSDWQVIAKPKAKN
ncbi:bifunctional diaminohydroxyphosphoribosylaminopyrimidine deaminase/5-amino-6-(5-phosphoribosylamino)uracil reductase RibD [Sessilibacter corallicola]|uniref:bifunctional diaminohydroxyphosphoribosylaminopyrimidine deaminase/5-amino-6-(5-phosphoribosylamino)uracil reductase RibD n=1 Tax=Sessilibacter corallicola TaxID=2904075 RepID=UPI001E3917AB|nr:bifunctional diaminohydroxyphosphoribosylaminopyrimidine deaminase/5-amino-6-(5-phosphoribosylamino)uracil reductase RibD [Sessilibacter corallicola]MCE2027537.1 bifunctional diaminohydroxyphosphoribosylaminopyrimidine deaminase/5-amino-6-(5-phosphoribosylamino)uracil reductase RibD [Sessilibacter corallicola]